MIKAVATELESVKLRVVEVTVHACVRACVLAKNSYKNDQLLTTSSTSSRGAVSSQKIATDIYTVILHNSLKYFRS